MRGKTQSNRPTLIKMKLFRRSATVVRFA
jgi:hypothetical protein